MEMRQWPVHLGMRQCTCTSMHREKTRGESLLVASYVRIKLNGTREDFARHGR